jgi:transposase
MDERMRFVVRLKDGETMASLCREFGISRKTGYKIFERYEECGLEGLNDRSRKPYRYANRLPEQIEAAIVAAKREKPSWGARKIRERLLPRSPRPGHPGTTIADAHRGYSALGGRQPELAVVR